MGFRRVLDIGELLLIKRDTQVLSLVTAVAGSILGSPELSMAGMAGYQTSIDPAGMGQWNYGTSQMR